MKYFNLAKPLLFISIFAGLFSSCKKVQTADPLEDKGQRIVQIVGYGGTGDNFGTSSLAFDPSSSSEIVELRLYLSSPVLSATDITATLASDSNARIAFNTANPDQIYQQLPTDAYTLATDKVVIKAGESVSQPFFVEFHPDMIDGSINLMLPLAIKALDGAPADVKIASGTGIAYFHFIGNPLAGFYSTTGDRKSVV